VLADPDGADIVYILLDDPGFDPDHPSYQFTDLQNGVEFYFTVSAVDDDGESDMSNKISGTNGDSNTNMDSNLTPSQNSTSGSGASGGSFISTLR